jgi:hypothetical protein
VVAGEGRPSITVLGKGGLGGYGPGEGVEDALVDREVGRGRSENGRAGMGFGDTVDLETDGEGDEADASASL